MVSQRNHSVDAIKGTLILFVVLGHVLLGTLDENVLRYVIYSFHMPAFFFVSGYLLNIERLHKQSFTEMFGKYWCRMLAEWLVAWIIFTAVVLYKDFNIATIARNVYHPYYHLWFIPSLFFMISIVWMLVRKIEDNFLRLSLLMTFGILFFNLTGTDFKLSATINCAYLPFLVLGIISHDYVKLFNIQGGVIISIYLIINLLLRPYVDDTTQCLNNYLRLPFLLMLCLYGLLPIMQRQRFHSQVLEFWGKHSLHIYLWHVIPILAFKKFLIDNEIAYYAVSFSTMIALAVITKLWLRHQASNRITEN